MRAIIRANASLSGLLMMILFIRAESGTRKAK
jgi:hypothetical protein